MDLNLKISDGGDFLALAANVFNQTTDSSLFLFIKIFLMVYTIVLVIDLFFLLYFKGIGSDVRKGLTGMDMPYVSKGKMEKKWDKVKERLKTGSVSQYKVAILEADSIVDDIIGRIGHGGGNMTEKLEQLKAGQLDYQEELLEVHQIRNKIVHDENFIVDRELAEKTVGVYEKFLRYLEFM